jgi:uncharacterized lipoprotein NlpE involved in copper resistance
MKFLLAFICAVALSGCDYRDDAARDAVKQYELAVKGGNKAEIAVSAETVAQAYKLAGDEKNYLKWRKIADDAMKNHMDSYKVNF